MSIVSQLQEMEGASRAITLPPSRATQINREHARPGVGAQENRLGHRDGPDLDLKGDRGINASRGNTSTYFEV